MIYIKNVHFATINALLTRIVKCEHCGTVFIYFMEVEAEGSADSPYFLTEKSAKKSAAHHARVRMNSLVEKCFLSIPCPSCFLYQKYMFKAVRDVENTSVTLGFGGLLVGGVLAIGLRILYGLTNAEWIWYLAIATFAVFTLPFLYYGSHAAKRLIHFDPNDMPESHRKKIAGEQAVEKSLFEKSVHTMHEEEFTLYVSELTDNYDGHAPHFDVPFWIDETMLENDVMVDICLPTGEFVEIEIERGELEGKKYRFRRVVNNHKIVFCCILRTYTQTQRRLDQI